MKSWELLAPVGSREALIAAVQNGCDAVYLGSTKFSARASAANFDEEAMAWAVEYTHMRGVRLFVTVNTLYRYEEMPKVISLVDELYYMGVDGIIIQDLGLAAIASGRYPGMELHASTQMFIHNMDGGLYMEEMGFDRVVVARETSLKEISNMKKHLNIPMEGFIHGALCVCYSGQCLFSSLIGGRSGNRGRCAQPCRKPYTLDNNKGYFLSPRELTSLDTIVQWHEAGIYSFKIEGRMKRPEYVATVVGTYNKALTNAITEQDRDDIAQIFNRGFTNGLAFDSFGKTFINENRPDNKGVQVGIVSYEKKGKPGFITQKPIAKGDGLAIEMKNSITDGWTVNSEYEKGDWISIPIRGISEDDKVYRTSSVELLNRAADSYGEERIKIGLKGLARISIGEKPRLRVSDGTNEFEIIGESIVEQANKVELNKEMLTSQWSRFGDTNFYWEELVLDLGSGCFMSKGALNAMRRELEQKITDKYLGQRPKRAKDLPILLKVNEKVIETKISVSIKTVEQWEKIPKEFIKRVYMPLRIVDNEILKEAKSNNLELYIKFPPVMETPDLEKAMESLYGIKEQISGVEAVDLGSFRRLLKEGYKVHGGASMQVFNPWSGIHYKSKGMSSYTASRELSIPQLQTLSEYIEMSGEVICYGFAPAMITRHCPASTIRNCKDSSNCGTCSYNNGHALVDERGISFRFHRQNGLTEILNSYPIWAPDELKNLRKQGWEYLRMEFTIEEDPEKIIRNYYNSLMGIFDADLKEELIERYGSITKGHLRRGVE
ncbi:MAG: U32 family peptidase [Tissierellia bacterium]|nr:U32 family peptidase [Tissierellia bacterium]